MSMAPTVFECHFYISGRNQLRVSLPAQSKPQKIARLKAPNYEALIDPAFRRLLAAFESLPATCAG
jgi:hypothetical protein